MALSWAILIPRLILLIGLTRANEEVELVDSEVENEEKTADRAEFIRTDCQKTNITVYIPKWIVDRSSPDLVRFDSSSCQSKEFNKTHYFLYIDLIDPKKDCSTRRNSEGVQVIYENLITWFNKETKVVEKLAEISCAQYLEEKHVRLPPEKSINEFIIKNKNGTEHEYKLQMSLFPNKDYTEKHDFADKGFVQVGVGEFIYIRYNDYDSSMYV